MGPGVQLRGREALRDVRPLLAPVCSASAPERIFLIKAAPAPSPGRPPESGSPLHPSSRKEITSAAFIL